MMKTGVGLSMCLLASACTLLPPEPPKMGSDPMASIAATKEECQSLNHKWMVTSVITGVSGGLATASGIGASVSAAEKTSTGVTAGIGGGGILLGIVAAITGGLSGKYAQEYVNKCTVNAAGR